MVLQRRQHIDNGDGTEIKAFSAAFMQQRYNPSGE
jgi:hypothetical protein